MVEHDVSCALQYTSHRAGLEQGGGLLHVLEQLGGPDGVETGYSSLLRDGCGTTGTGRHMSRSEIEGRVDMPPYDRDAHTFPVQQDACVCCWYNSHEKLCS